MNRRAKIIDGISCDARFVWARSVRVFHWLNFVLVVALIVLGTAIHFTGELGLSVECNIAIKFWHTIVGYLFTSNIAWRSWRAVAGDRYSSWREIAPLSVGKTVAYIRALRAGHSKRYTAHNPLGRISITLFMLIFMCQSITGLILAGTDLYMPPFGGMIVRNIAAAGTSPSDVMRWVPGGASEKLKAQLAQTVDPEKYVTLREAREPINATHIWAYYVLIPLILLHVISVVLSEIYLGGSLVSAMITGHKVWIERPRPHNEARPSSIKFSNNP